MGMGFYMQDRLVKCLACWRVAQDVLRGRAPNPRFYRTSHKTSRRKQRQLSRREIGSHRRGKAAKSGAKTHLKINRQRRDHHFKVAQQYTLRYRRIVVEDVRILGMVKNHHLAKSILDASWGRGQQLLWIANEQLFIDLVPL
jgi:transposase